MEEFRLEDLSDERLPRLFAAQWRARRASGVEKIRLDVSAAGGDVEVALAWHEMLYACEPLPVVTRLTGNVGLPGYLAWLGGIGYEAAPAAGVWIGQHGVVPYCALWHRVRDLIASRIVCTEYQDRRGYPLRTAIDLLFDGTLLGPADLARLHCVRIIEP